METGLTIFNGPVHSPSELEMKILKGPRGLFNIAGFNFERANIFRATRSLQTVSSR